MIDLTQHPHLEGALRDLFLRGPLKRRYMPSEQGFTDVIREGLAQLVGSQWAVLTPRGLGMCVTLGFGAGRAEAAPRDPKADLLRELFLHGPAPVPEDDVRLELATKRGQVVTLQGWTMLTPVGAEACLVGDVDEDKVSALLLSEAQARAK